MLKMSEVEQQMLDHQYCAASTAFDITPIGTSVERIFTMSQCCKCSMHVKIGCKET